jgi:hypothetical protein
MSEPTLSLIADTATVDSVARPSAPPTCCIVFSTPEPTPESRWSTRWTAARVIGTNVRPMPTAISTMNGNRSVQ